eukprot:2061939-Rhodomonas_salina.4
MAEGREVINAHDLEEVVQVKASLAKASVHLVERFEQELAQCRSASEAGRIEEANARLEQLRKLSKGAPLGHEINKFWETMQKQAVALNKVDSAMKTIHKLSQQVRVLGALLKA